METLFVPITIARIGPFLVPSSSSSVVTSAAVISSIIATVAPVAVTSTVSIAISQYNSEPFNVRRDGCEHNKSQEHECNKALHDSDTAVKKIYANSCLEDGDYALKKIYSNATKC